ncbi:glycosyltransferase family 2 protein [Pseudocitrobacter cyperus]|uniref:Glycosyltransferase family 2 protein n=1 Tax=Pseudocitrobacter cyperus TaxID=3112843 RepID=A0ABV0HFN8_9ENTR
MKENVNPVMTDTPTVSIIIPAYNSAEFIHILLDSLLKQTIKDFEVIVVDDGSRDATSAVVSKYGSDDQLNLKLIQQVNAGVSAARNAGFDHAQGEFCIFIDSDDHVAPDFLENLLTRQAETQADVVYCGCHQGGKKGVNLKPNKFQEGYLLAQRIQREMLFHLGGVLIRRTFLIAENIRFNPDLKLGEDLLFTYTILAKTHLYAVQKYLYHQTWRDDSVMNATWSKTEYEHNALAMQVIYDSINQWCPESEREAIAPLLRNAAFAAKIKFLWALLQSRHYAVVLNYLNNGFLKLSNEEINRLARKEAKKYKILQCKNKFIWAMYFCLRKKKF